MLDVDFREFTFERPTRWGKLGGGLWAQVQVSAFEEEPTSANWTVIAEAFCATAP